MIILGNYHKINTKILKRFNKKSGSLKIVHRGDVQDDKHAVEEIKQILETDSHKTIVLNVAKEISRDLMKFLHKIETEGVRIITYDQFYSEYLDKKHIGIDNRQYEELEKIHHIWRIDFKRAFDFVFALFAILLFSPLYVITAFLIKKNSPEGSAFFVQKRLGRYGREFNVYKFRTMIPNAEKVLEEWLETHSDIREEYLTFRKLKTDPRIIPGIGNFLRKTSLDELPQFFNVLKGEMSIVGPRPYIKDEFCNHTQKVVDAIVSVKPGVTGLWQVMERNKSTFKRRVHFDLVYIKKQSFLMDTKIIFLTIWVMLFKKGS